MRSFYLAAVLAASAHALNIPRDPEPEPAAASTAPGPTNTIVVYKQPEFPIIPPEVALTQLWNKAIATPSAVSILPDVPIPTSVAQAISSAKANPPKSNTKASGSSSDTSASPKVANVAAASCTNPQTHYEWRALSSTHKTQFVNAMKCLMGKPSRSGLSGAKNRWDDLVAIHQRMAPTIHNVGQFLPWHRYMLKMLEMEMRKTCGYSGPMTWWDETKDAGNFNGAPLNTESYFGHAPLGQTVCITSGVFKNTQCHIGPGTSNVNHCLARGVNEQTSSGITSSYVSTCLSYGSYNDMQNCLFFGPHGLGHNALGGDMSDVNASPNDPLFYMHHAFINRNWRIWQRTNPSARTYAIGGSTTQNCGSSCQPTTLDYQLTSFGFFPAVSVRDVMDTLGPYLCYKYDY